MIRKTFSAQTKVLDPAQGLVETMFAITANVDRQNDRIIPGAFAKALAAKTSVPVCYAHKWDDLSAVLGKTVQWAELRPGDSRLPANLLQKGYGGVKATVQFELGVPAGQIAFTHVRNKNITNWSWAFDVDPDEGEKYTSDGNVREIKSVREIFEVTLTLVGANQEALTLAVQKTMALQRRPVTTHSYPSVSEILAKKRKGKAIDAHINRRLAEVFAKSEEEPRDFSGLLGLGPRAGMVTKSLAEKKADATDAYIARRVADLIGKSEARPRFSADPAR